MASESPEISVSITHDNINCIVRDGSGWDEKTEEVLNVWIFRLKHIRDDVNARLDSHRSKYHRYNMISCVASGTSTLFATFGAIVSDDLKLAFTAASAGTAFITFILTSLIQEKSLDSKIQDLSSHLSSISNLIAILETETELPLRMRKNADDLILSISTIYTDIMSKN